MLRSDLADQNTRINSPEYNTFQELLILISVETTLILEVLRSDLADQSIWINSPEQQNNFLSPLRRQEHLRIIATFL